MTDRMICLRDYIVAHKHFDLRQPKQVYENIDISVTNSLNTLVPVPTSLNRASL